MGSKMNMKKIDVINWLYSSNLNKDQWVRSEQDKIEEAVDKQCTFKPQINKRGPNDSKTKVPSKTHDNFYDLYQKAKRDRAQQREIQAAYESQYGVQKTEGSQMPSNPDVLPSSKESVYSMCDNPSDQHRESAHESNPEITSNLKQLDAGDLEYVNRKIEEIKTANEYVRKFDENEYSSNNDQSNSKFSPMSPTKIGNVISFQNRLTSETPKTEELEEEMRDQVMDYQRPLLNDMYKPVEKFEINIQGKSAICWYYKNFWFDVCE